MIRLQTTLLAAALCATIAGPAFANPQHDRMRDCNKTAKEKALKGDERKAFMKQCLSGPNATEVEAKPAK